jgi:hypothetical protein
MYIIKGNTIDEELVLLTEAINILMSRGFQIKTKCNDFNIYINNIFVVLYGNNDISYARKISNKIYSYKNNFNDPYLQDKKDNLNTYLYELNSRSGVLFSFQIIPFDNPENQVKVDYNSIVINSFVNATEKKNNPINPTKMYIIHINSSSLHYITFNEDEYFYDYLIRSVNSIIIDRGDYFNFPKGLTYQVNYPTLAQLKIFSNWFQVREESKCCNQHNYEYYKLYTTNTNNIYILNIYKYIFRKFNPRLTLQKDQYTIYNNKYEYTVLLQPRYYAKYLNIFIIDNIYNISIFSQKNYVDLETNIKNLFSCVENPKKNKYRLRCFITNLPICYDNSKYIYLICIECEVNGLYYIKYICVHPLIALYYIKTPEISKYINVCKFLKTKIIFKYSSHSIKLFKYKINRSDELNYRYLEKNTYSIYNILNRLSISIYKKKIYCHCLPKIELLVRKLYRYNINNTITYFSTNNSILNGKKIIYTNFLTDSFIIKQLHIYDFKPIIFVVLKYK